MHVRKSLGSAIVAALPSPRSGVAEWRDTQAAQARLTLLQRLRRQGGGLELPRPQILDNGISRREQPCKPWFLPQSVHIGAHRVLAAVFRLEIERIFTGKGRAAAPQRRPGRRLNFDHGRSQVSE